jgi:ribosome-associated protein
MVDDVAQQSQVQTVAPVEVAAAATAAESKGARDIVVLDVTEVSGITSYFLICSAPSDRQVKAIVGAIEQQVADLEGTRPLAIEGADTFDWVLMNYGYFLVHVFQQESREFYDLERLWRDAPRPTW